MPRVVQHTSRVRVVAQEYWQHTGYDFVLQSIPLRLQGKSTKSIFTKWQQDTLWKGKKKQNLFIIISLKYILLEEAPSTACLDSAGLET